MAPVSVSVPLPVFVMPKPAPLITLETARLEVPTLPPLLTAQVWEAPRSRFDSLIVKVRAVVFAELVAVMPLFTVKSPAPSRTEIFAVELLNVRVPAVMALFTVVLPAAENVALSPVVQATPLEPFHQVLPSAQLPLPPAVALPEEVQVKLAAFADMHKSARARIDAVRRSFIEREVMV